MISSRQTIDPTEEVSQECPKRPTGGGGFRRETLFTVGPVEIPPHLLRLAAMPPPYNRTIEFSDVTRRILADLRYWFDTAGEVVILTSSGTGAMEASVANLLDEHDRVLVVDGGVFGRRWADLCELHRIPFERLEVAAGCDLDPNVLDRRLQERPFTVILMAAHETSTGVLYDVKRIGEVARERGVFLVVDGISSIGADAFQMDAWGIGAALCSSQKAMALPPGLAFVALGESARERMHRIQPRSFYFRFDDYLRNQERGQSPFTPAVGLYAMLRQRLSDVRRMGMDACVAEHARRARHFRSCLHGLPLRPLALRPSNALTTLEVSSAVDAREIVKELAYRFGLRVTPNSGDLQSRMFRVGHLGEQSCEDLDQLADCLRLVLGNRTK